MARYRPGDRRRTTEQLERVYIRDGGICYLCDKFVPRELASRDHVVDLSKGGSGDDDNVKLSHMKCNELKSSAREDLFAVLINHDSYVPEYLQKEYLP